MIGEPATQALTGGVELLDRAIAYTRVSLQTITPEALSNPTPCEGWDLRMLLAHMDDSLAALCEAADVGRIEVDEADLRADPMTGTIVRLRERSCRLLSWSAEAIGDDVISVAEHHLPAKLVTTTGALEIAVHGWDVAEACGISRPIPAPLAERMLELLHFLISEEDRPVRFGLPVPVPSSASPSDRLVALLGRSTSS